MSCVKVKLICVPSDFTLLIGSAMGLNFVICIKCEMNKAKDYTFTLLAKVDLDEYLWTIVISGVRSSSREPLNYLLDCKHIVTSFEIDKDPSKGSA